MSPKVVLYTFAGRKPNMELQLPLVRRILDEHSEVRFDIWNLTKTARDDFYVQSLGGPGVRVRQDFQRVLPWWRRFDKVWHYYTQGKYADTLFVKIDDDVVFLETERWDDFIAAVRAAPGIITSALTINNGASTPLIPGQLATFKKLKMPLLDVHLHGTYARFSHDFALEHWDELIDMQPEAVATKDWMSINAIAYDWTIGCKVAELLGQQSPAGIAGRKFKRGQIIGDEGACNMFPRQVFRGFLAAHLTFGPQELPEEIWTEYRKRYAEVGRLYLER